MRIFTSVRINNEKILGSSKGSGHALSRSGLFQTACKIRLLLLIPILAFAFPFALQAQFNYTTNDGAIIITGYTGEGGAVDIPNMIDGLPVAGIGERAFEYCGSLTNISFGGHVASIADWAFHGCGNLTSCTIPNNITSIGFNCFSSCIRLTNFVISSGLTNFGAPVVSGCSRLRAITVDALNPSYCSIDGVLFNKSQTTLIECPPYKMFPFTIPGSVTNIGIGAFSTCGLITVTIPDSVTTIGSRAFEGCRYMASVTIPDCVNLIGGFVFADCASLTNVSIGKGVTNIASSAFSGCRSLKRLIIPDSVSKIGPSLFQDCSSLTSVIFGKGIRVTGLMIFDGCTRLTSVYFKGNAPFVVDSHMFDHLYYVTVYYLPGTTSWSSGLAGRPAKLWNPQPVTTDASFGVQTNQYGFTIAGTEGIGVVVEACANLANPVWYPVGTNVIAGGKSYFSDPDWTNHPNRFYRFRAP